MEPKVISHPEGTDGCRAKPSARELSAGSVMDNPVFGRYFPDFGKHRGDRAEARQRLFDDRRDQRIVRIGPERDGKMNMVKERGHRLFPGPVDRDRHIVGDNAIVGKGKEDLHANASPERSDQVLDGIGDLPVPAHPDRRFHREGYYAVGGGEFPVAVVGDGHVDRLPFHPRLVPGDLLRTHGVPVVPAG